MLILMLPVPVNPITVEKRWHKKIAITPQLTFGGAPLVDINANQPLDQVLVDVEKAITEFMATRGYHHRASHQTVSGLYPQ